MPTKYPGTKVVLCVMPHPREGWPAVFGWIVSTKASPKSTFRGGEQLAPPPRIAPFHAERRKVEEV